MKIILLGCCFLYLSTMRVDSKPQITKLYPVPEESSENEQEPELQRQMSNEVKPLDKFLGKLRATYNFVFRKPEDTGNVERILAKDAPNPDIEALKLIWTSSTPSTMENQTTASKTNSRESKMLTITGNNWMNDVQPPETSATLAPLELEVDDKNLEVEVINPNTGLQLPVTLSRQLVDWLGSLLGLSYSVYSKLAKAVHLKN